MYGCIVEGTRQEKWREEYAVFHTETERKEEKERETKEMQRENK